MSGVYLSMRYSGRLDSDESLKIKRDVYQYCIKEHFPEFEFLESIDLKSDTAFSISYENIVATKTALQIPWDSSSSYIKEGEILTSLCTPFSALA